MKLVKIKRDLLIAIVIICVFQIYNLITSIRISDKYCINCDLKFSNDVNVAIRDFINSNLKKKLPDVFSKGLKEKFEAIDSVILQRKKSHLLTVTIKSNIPKIIVNNNFVITYNKHLLSKNFFAKSVLQDLENIESQEKIISNFFIEFINKLPNELLKNHRIIWENKNSILLIDKNDDQLTILIRHDQIPNEKLLNACRKLKIENKINKKMRADLRFDKQIIISQI